MIEHTALLETLEQNIERILKQWPESNWESNPLSGLQIFQSRRSDIGNDRGAIGEVVSNALKILAIDSQDDAELLSQVYFNEEPLGTLAVRRHVSQATIYRYKDNAIRQLALILRDQELQARRNWQMKLEQRLDIPALVHLFGFDTYLNRLLEITCPLASPWLICIDGIGGIGKTALANALIRQPQISGQFQKIAWINAKLHYSSSASGHAQQSNSVIHLDDLIDLLLRQLDPDIPSKMSTQHRWNNLIKVVKQKPCLIVVDNLETIEEHQALLPILQKLSNPSKILVTSRHSFRTHADVFCLNLSELDKDDACQLIKTEGKSKGAAEIETISEEQLASIYQVVGGNPLAIKLVLGQMTCLSLPQVLSNLQNAIGKPIVDLYNYIYWQTWHLLDTAAQTTLLIMPLVRGGDFEQLETVTELDIEQLTMAIQQLVTLSMLEVQGELADKRYSIHRLTETFLLNEAVRWQTTI